MQFYYYSTDVQRDESGKRKAESGKQKAESGERKAENGERRAKNRVSTNVLSL